MSKLITNFHDISYLHEGNNTQKRVFTILTDSNIMGLLRDFDPILVGTIPIGINIPKSDLDIVCELKNRDVFIETVNHGLSIYSDLTITHKTDRVIARFNLSGFDVEIFAQDIKTVDQNGYRHMIVEYRLLNLMSNKNKKEIVRLKLSGLKTEPAFAKLLNISGNPFEALLDLEARTDLELGYLVKRALTSC